jgi:hypothetical protein
MLTRERTIHHLAPRKRGEVDGRSRRRRRFIHAVSLLCLLTTACAAPTPAAAPPTPTAEVARFTIDVDRPNAREEWQRLSARLSSCQPVDAEIWYALGSATLRAREADGLCAIELVTEVEGAREVLRCRLPSNTIFAWDLVAEGDRPREAPPRKPPPALSNHCRPG